MASMLHWVPDSSRPPSSRPSLHTCPPLRAILSCGDWAIKGPCCSQPHERRVARFPCAREESCQQRGLDLLQV